jgi:hypothetical protein
MSAALAAAEREREAALGELSASRKRTEKGDNVHRLQILIRVLKRYLFLKFGSDGGDYKARRVGEGAETERSLSRGNYWYCEAVLVF